MVYKTGLIENAHPSITSIGLPLWIAQSPTHEYGLFHFCSACTRSGKDYPSLTEWRTVLKSFNRSKEFWIVLPFFSQTMSRYFIYEGGGRLYLPSLSPPSTHQLRSAFNHSKFQFLFAIQTSLPHPSLLFIELHIFR